MAQPAERHLPAHRRRARQAGAGMRAQASSLPSWRPDWAALGRWLWPAAAAADARLPARVRLELEREQFRGELLVTAVQLLLVVLLALLYGATPDGFAPDAPIEAAPLGFCFFALLALV